MTDRDTPYLDRHPVQESTTTSSDGFAVADRVLSAATAWNPLPYIEVPVSLAAVTLKPPTILESTGMLYRGRLVGEVLLGSLHFVGRNAPTTMSPQRASTSLYRLARFAFSLQAYRAASWRSGSVSGQRTLIERMSVGSVISMNSLMEAGPCSS